MSRLATNLQQYIQLGKFYTIEEEVKYITDEEKVILFELLNQSIEVPEKNLPTFCPESKIYKMIDQIIQKIVLDNEYN